MFAEGKRVKAFAGFAHKADLHLDQLDAAASMLDLNLPGNRFEALKGHRKGQYSVRINDQWRICFEWPKGARAKQCRDCGLSLGGTSWDAVLFIPANISPNSW